MNHLLTWIIFLQACVALIWSLYFGYFGDPVMNIIDGELFNTARWLVPCELCRRARVLMYPLVPLSLFGLIQKNTSFVDYTLLFSGLWIILESYHYLLQKFSLPTSFSCTFNQPCTALDVNYLWFITIPFLCLLAFLVIFVCSIRLKKKEIISSDESL